MEENPYDPPQTMIGAPHTAGRERRETIFFWIAIVVSVAGTIGLLALFASAVLLR